MKNSIERYGPIRIRDELLLPPAFDKKALKEAKFDLCGRFIHKVPPSVDCVLAEKDACMLQKRYYTKSRSWYCIEPSEDLAGSGRCRRYPDRIEKREQADDLTPRVVSSRYGMRAAHRAVTQCRFMLLSHRRN